MADVILVDGDTATFLPSFGAAVVVVQPGRMAASGPATLNGRKLCVDGDESRLSVPGCSYVTPQYCIPGSGTLKIASLAGDQKAMKTKSGGKQVLLRGSRFTAKFEVSSPAQMPPPGSGSPVPDPAQQYRGSGMFTSQNTLFKGT